MIRVALVGIGLIIAGILPAATQGGHSINGERSNQRIGESGAAASGTLQRARSGNDPNQPHQITSTATGGLSLTREQRDKIAKFSVATRTQTEPDKSVSRSRSAPRYRVKPNSCRCRPFQRVVPAFHGDQYILVQDQLIMATPVRRIVALIPNTK